MHFSNVHTLVSNSFVHAPPANTFQPPPSCIVHVFASPPLAPLHSSNHLPLVNIFLTPPHRSPSLFVPFLVMHSFPFSHMHPTSTPHQKTHAHTHHILTSHSHIPPKTQPPPPHDYTFDDILYPNCSVAQYYCCTLCKVHLINMRKILFYFHASNSKNGQSSPTQTSNCACTYYHQQNDSACWERTYCYNQTLVFHCSRSSPFSSLQTFIAHVVEHCLKTIRTISK
eukprot:gb/GEZJ01005112.1/.p1 GENE.gb/GEZJ01005112.1/~~gb/GEZJ01005112.1/.p1  ORF type:complete len:226 (+),score=5.80 gb/GEZJ01005112.1/:407-1084(+)